MSPKTRKTKPTTIQTIECRVGMWKDKLVALLGHCIVKESRMALVSEIEPYPGMAECYRAVEPICLVNEVSVRWHEQPVKIVVEEV